MEKSGSIPIFNIPGTLFGNIWEYFGNVSWKLSTNIPQTDLFGGKFSVIILCKRRSSGHNGT